MTYDIEKKVEHQLIEKGEYEVRIERFVLRESKTGNPYYSIWLRIRDDVVPTQKFANSIVFDILGSKKDESTGETRFNVVKMSYLASGVKDFKKTTFNTIEDYIKYFTGKTTRVAVDIDEQYNRNVVKFYALSKSEEASTSIAPVGGFKEVTSDEDLPF